MGAKQKQQNKKKAVEKLRTLKSMLAKGTVLAAVVVCVIVILEKRQIFVEDSMNNHVEWKWDWYYRMRQYNIPIDVLLVGNSHLLTGFNPYEFTTQRGLTCFLLGASGVGVADLYFTIDEALKVQQPKVLVLETYDINESDPLKLENGALNDEINCYRARRDT